MSSGTPRIAIVGMALRFAGASDPTTYARLLEGGIDASRLVPEGRWPALADGVVRDGALGVPGCVPTARGYFLDAAASEAADLRGLALDPLFGLTLNVGREALQSCRREDLDFRRVGVILGNLALPTTASSQLAQELLGAAYLERMRGDEALRALSVSPANAAVAGLPALLLARKLGLGGVSFALDAACASSLYAIRLAMRELIAGRADAMIAGGVSRPDPFYTQMGFAQLKALAPDGKSRPFDARASGLVVGEGAGMFVLKRLDDALRAGDRIYGLIAGAGISNDLDAGMMAPSAEGQLRALRDAYAEAGWDPRDVDFVEGHATGTPLGDQVEVQSLKSLWNEAGGAVGRRIPLGSVKANVGHLLTAAGASSLAKALLAIARKTVAPTANFERAAERLGLEESGFEILREARALSPRREGAPLRAGISGFGFGGINAHLLIEEWQGRAPAAASPARPAREVVVVGVGVRTARFASFAALTQSLAGNGADPIGTSSPPWFGLEETETFAQLVGTPAPAAALHTVELDAASLRLPPLEVQDLNPQQLLALAAASEAARAAGLAVGGREPRGGVFLGIALDGTTNHFSCRFVHGEAAGFVPELTAARVLGNLASVAASRIARAFGLGGLGIGVAAEAASGRQALRLAAEAIRSGELSVALSGAVDCAAQYLNAQTRRLGKEAALPTEDAAVLFVLKDRERARADGDRILARVDASGELGETALSEDVEHGAATGLLDAARAVAMLGNTLLPGGDYWLRDRATASRSLWACGLRFFEHDEAPPAFASSVVAGQALFLVAAPDRAALATAAEAMLAKLARSATAAWPALALETWEEAALAAATGGSRCRIALLWSGESEPLAMWREFLAETTRPKAPALRIDEARGMWFADGPGDDPPKLAYLFPGAGSHYRDMGRQLAAAFPAVMERHDRECAHLRSQWGADAFWSERATQPDMVEALGGPCALAAYVVDLLAAFGIAPEATVGYSLGESAALIAMRAWQDRDRVYERLRSSPIFTTALSGPMHAARKHFGLSAAEPLEWTNMLVRRSAEDVRGALSGTQRVYLNNVNAPQECVIGGDARAVRAVLRKLGHAPLELPRIPTLHCPVVQEIAEEFREFHEVPLRAPPGVTFYGGAHGEAIPMTSRGAAEAILAHAWHGVDFPKVIERAYADGVRVFLEIGPGAGLTRLVREILGTRPFAATSICPREGQELSGFFGGLALAFVHGRSPKAEKALLVAPEVLVPKAPVRVALGGEASPAAREGPAASFTPTVHEPAAFAPVEHEESMTDAILSATIAARAETAAAHAAYLSLTREVVAATVRALHASPQAPAAAADTVLPSWDLSLRAPFNLEPAWLDFAQCQTLARDHLGDVLGAEFAAVDLFPTRVRLPDGPLLLCHRIMSVDAVPRSMSHGTLVTEHDVHADAWYLDDGRIPTCVAVEAGQADLFLSGYLGIDFKTEGRAVYRLLDAVVTFHDRLPEPGTTIRYAIKVHHFFEQGETTLFRFSFEATVAGRKLITMEQGCAGFFSAAELAAGRGIVKTELDLRKIPGKVTGDYERLVPMRHEAYDDAQLDLLRHGDYAGCFGEPFAALVLEHPKAMPGGMLRLVHRILELDPDGGRFGLGLIRGEADIHADDWFLTCHFVDDQVMPGTLMYECCNHTMRIFLMRAGWVGEADALPCEPLPGVKSRLKCRGQVLAGSKKVEYRIEIKEIGYGPDAYAIADALMFVDGKPIVEILDMSLCHLGLTKERAAAVWGVAQVASEKKPALYDYERILAFSSGNPSEAFGEPYAIFDTPRGAKRKIARLPRPPYQFLDRITALAAEPWQLEAGGTVEAQYDVPRDAWYFAASGATPTMPFAVLLEIALQPCGWYSAYMGSALASPVDLSYRNLGGRGVQHREVTPEIGTLTTTVVSTKVSQSAGMIIQSFEFRVTAAAGLVYEGDTMFGFFTKEALAQQVGLRGVARPEGIDAAPVAAYPDRPNLPCAPILMLDEIVRFSEGRLHGRKAVDPAEWFFEAHFFEDPVMPGSLGLEAFLQLLMLAAAERWPEARGFRAVAPGAEHSWTYRGQVIPRNAKTDVFAEVTATDDAARRLTGRGVLTVDGLPIYEMVGFAVEAL